MMNSKAMSVPLANHFKLSNDQKPKTDHEMKKMSAIPYANIIGSIMYTMICTRPDVAQAISVANRYMANHGREHWSALKWIMRYLKGSTGYGLRFRSKDCHEEDALQGYCDLDYASNRDNRKSQSGYIFNLYGTAISWKSNLQSVVALSTTEAEYIALAEVVKEGLWLKGIMEDFGVKQEVVEIRCDSNNAICLSKHQVFHERSKHIDVRMHFIRDEVQNGRIRVEKVSTDHNAADMLTKPLPASKFRYCLDLVGMCPLQVIDVLKQERVVFHIAKVEFVDLCLCKA
ncbi:secreted RxLR effector protein 161-like protein [Salvia divinorum]|uniref:Secreted RxLR effector protein 161-like protein n=1 Tax=Salvia divinorum TaxID=28513 RepID=A0ABD1GR87_SALDI